MKIKTILCLFLLTSITAMPYARAMHKPIKKAVSHILNFATKHEQQSNNKLNDEAEKDQEQKRMNFFNDNPDIFKAVMVFHELKKEGIGLPGELKRIIIEHIKHMIADENGKALLDAIQAYNANGDQNTKNRINQLLNEHYINVNIQSEYSRQSMTALHLISSRQWDQDYREEIVRILLEKGANINLQDRFGCTILYHAVLHDLKTIEMLLQKGANPNLQSKEGDTALHLAVKKNKLNIVELLLQRSADPNLQNQNGDTALHIAVETGRSSIVEMLLKKNIDFNLQDNKGETALDIATLFKYTEIIKMLNDAHENQSLNL